MGTRSKIIGIVLIASLLSACSNSRRAHADAAFNRMAYATASAKYDQLLQKKFDRSIALRAAIAHSKLNDLHRAVELYGMAQKEAPLQTTDGLLYGMALQQIGEVANAEIQFKNILASDSGNVIAKRLLDACYAHTSYTPATPLYEIQPVRIPELPEAFCAVPYGKGVVFAGANASVNAKRTNPLNGHSFLDLYYGEPNAQGDLADIKPLFGIVNGMYHDGPATFSSDGRTMFFSRSDYMKHRIIKDEQNVSHVQLFRAEKQRNGSWENVEQFAFNSDGRSIGQAALSADGRTLYMISDMPGGFGGTDVYQCKWMLNAWSPPENLGPTINTPGNEMFPTVLGDTLFFSSNGHGGLGGLDVFSSAYTNDDWSLPANMNAPINSTYDDFSLQFRNDGSSGFLSSNRDGKDGIYSLRKLPVEQLSKAAP
ncbi:MAG: PD40 domain-containing protein [Flavobacteriales bacterium]|nr:PD40 domain-containing protein [Flavobacteriales bacterium]MBK6946496.1 PD40 domain-containing protein [Flavobacteriales bacterium]MBK7239764.1 PD40 domain-containing protein [Flavobacteriales bacterium]MBK7297904.1 PD40 domain-containing protein [Flavobacteriales bacterium]MBK9536547.1 PD40 domain-containing protein [Flavobacteriales bacterium]